MFNIWPRAEVQIKLHFHFFAFLDQFSVRFGEYENAVIENLQVTLKVEIYWAYTIFGYNVKHPSMIKAKLRTANCVSRKK